jgi:hypothetical protein
MSPETQPETAELEVPTPATAKKFAPITRTVFDLATFDDLKLQKAFIAPVQPASADDALALVGNDKQKLLNLIYDGMVAEARAAQYDDISGFHMLDENGKETAEEYSGKFADTDRGKAINLTILNMAKSFAGAAWDSLSTEEKNKNKKDAADMIRSTPAMLARVAG